jgi:hypothetical protein
MKAAVDLANKSGKDGKPALVTSNAEKANSELHGSTGRTLIRRPRQTSRSSRHRRENRDQCLVLETPQFCSAVAATSPLVH